MAVIQKYSDTQYVQSGFWDADSESDVVQAHSAKVVTVRLSHKCGFCYEDIQPGARALYEKAFIAEEGWCSTWTCLLCLDNWIDHIENNTEFTRTMGLFDVYGRTKRA